MAAGWRPVRACLLPQGSPTVLGSLGRLPRSRDPDRRVPPSPHSLHLHGGAGVGAGRTPPTSSPTRSSAAWPPQDERNRAARWSATRAARRQHKRADAAPGERRYREARCGRWSICPRKQASGRWSETRLSAESVTREASSGVLNFAPPRGKGRRRRQPSITTRARFSQRTSGQLGRWRPTTEIAP
jgi:hypothetical protein